jgi:peroxiredoxin
MTLNEQLTKWWDGTRERAPEVFHAYTLFVRALKAADIARQILKTGDLMPDFMLPNAEGQLVRSGALHAGGPLVLSFFRGGWCPYCVMELKALEAALPAIRRRSATLAAITPDTAAALSRDKRDHRLSFEILGDVDNGVALLFGLVFRVPPFIHDLWLSLGIDLGARHGNASGTWLLPIPATYIVDRRGIIRHAHIDSDFRKRMEPALILRRLSAIGRQ